MNFFENVREALKSIRDNKLRTALTGMIIAIGISSLVGILTAVDAIQSTISSGLSDLGANSFDITDLSYNARRSGKRSNIKEDISYREAKMFKEKFTAAERISIYAGVTSSAEVKYGSEKTNPNSVVAGIDQYYLSNKGYELESGRGFSGDELANGVPVAIIGSDISSTLFKKVDPIGEEISIRGFKFKVVGVLEKSGGLGGGRLDRSLFIPLEKAYRFSTKTRISYTITTTVKDPERLDYWIGEATGIMRIIRKDPLGLPASFEIERSESVATAINETSTNLKLGGSLVAFITLLGAAIGLMNIMLVSVTERTREIGIRKAIGATPSRIREQFLMEAITICIIGGLVGVFLGLLIGNLVTLLFDDSVFVFPLGWILMGLLLCVLVGVISGYFPARKASRLDPIDSLRYE